MMSNNSQLALNTLFAEFSKQSSSSLSMDNNETFNWVLDMEHGSNQVAEVKFA